MTDTMRSLYGKGASYNPRQITPEALTLLDRVLREFGDLGCIVFNVRTQTLVSGHQRQKCLDPSWMITKQPHEDATGTVALGYVEAPNGNRFTYREVDWDLDKEMAANLAANAQYGTFDDTKRADMLADLTRRRYDLDLTGHSKQVITDLFKLSPEQEEAVNSLNGFKTEPAGYQEQGSAPPLAPGRPKDQAALQGLNEEEAAHVLVDPHLLVRGDQIQWLKAQGAKVGLSASDLVRQAIDLFRRKCEADLNG